MDIVNQSIDAHLDARSRPDDPVLAEMEALAARRGFPYVGPQVGALLAWLARGIGARRVLELGSGFGYSAWWFARAVGAGGEVVLTENDAENVAAAEDFLARAGLGSRTQARLGDALEIAAELDGPFDVVFNDIDKQDYPRALEPAARLLRPGGLFVSDNMLWKGRVLDPAAADGDPATRGVLELTRRLTDDPRFDVVWLPVRDGLALARRRAADDGGEGRGGAGR